MSRFSQEMKVIPRAAWITGILLYLAMTTPLFFLAVSRDPDFKGWPAWGRVLFAYGPTLLVIPVIALFGYVYGDAKRRGMRYVMWTLLAIFIPQSIGVILYFVLRDPLPKPCPNCALPVKRGFTFCPNCGAATQPTCPACGKGVEFSWMNCPHCGGKLPSSGTQAARPQPVG
jgi:Double zinc ribbon